MLQDVEALLIVCEETVRTRLTCRDGEPFWNLFAALRAALAENEKLREESSDPWRLHPDEVRINELEAEAEQLRKELQEIKKKGLILPLTS